MIYNNMVHFDDMINVGYPDFLSTYSQCTNFTEIYNDNNFWMLLLQKDYLEIIRTNNFSKARETYITLYNNFIDILLPFARKIFTIYLDAINSDNLDLFKLLITYYTKSLNDGYEIVCDISTTSLCLKEFVFKLGIESKSYDIINYLLTVDEYMEFFLVCMVLTEYENLMGIFFNNINFDKSAILNNAIVNDDINMVKYIIQYINENKMPDMIVSAIDNDRETILLLLIKISKNSTIEESILKLISSNDDNIKNIKRYLLLIVMSFKSESQNTIDNEYNNLFINISQCKKTNEFAMICMEYILMTISLNKDTINESAIYTIRNCNMELFDVLLNHKLFDLEYDNSLLLRVIDNRYLESILRKIITPKNINNILLNIISNICENNILNILLGSYTNMIDMDILQTYLPFTVCNPRIFLLILSKLKSVINNSIQPNKYILNKCLSIACTKNIFAVVNTLLDYDIDTTNIYLSFDSALNNNNILIAAIILPPIDDICNYITDIKITKIINDLEHKESFSEIKDRKEILQVYVKSELIFFIKSLDLSYLENVFLKSDGRANLLRKYGKYITEYDIADIIDDIFEIR